jgi:SSS family solute:Na+ symporter
MPSRDFILYRKPEMPESRRVSVLRWSTLGFAFAIIVVGVVTSYYVTYHPNTQIIPLVLGILGFTFGSLLGIFLVGIFFTTRGNDFGNVLAMTTGFVAVVFFSNASLQSAVGISEPLVLAFPWRIACGAVTTILVAVCFPTPKNKLPMALPTIDREPSG